MNRQESPKAKSSPDRKNATQWLLHAYSVGHSQSCSCDRCAKAKSDLKDRKAAA